MGWLLDRFLFIYFVYSLIRTRGKEMILLHRIMKYLIKNLKGGLKLRSCFIAQIKTAFDKKGKPLTFIPVSDEYDTYVNARNNLKLQFFCIHLKPNYISFH